MNPIPGKHRGLVNGAHDPCEGDHAHVCQPHLLRLLVGVSPPNEEEGITVVLVGRAVILGHYAMNDLCNLVDEGHDLPLKDFSRRAEVAYLGSGNDAVHAAAWDHGIDAGGVQAPHVGADYVHASLSEAQGQQRPKLYDGLLQDDRLHGLLLGLVRAKRDRQALAQPSPLEAQPGRALVLGLVVLLQLLKLKLGIGHLHCNQGIVGNDLHLLDHSFHRVQHEVVSVMREEEGADEQHHADEGRRCQAHQRLLSDIGPDVEEERHVGIAGLAQAPELRAHPEPLLRTDVVRTPHAL
mmetsp:Transcript_25254/g.57319  ORF Transcript_25254/g.57319 Transcript_25254/m.57319 type:complete len:295 (-) Transcript_25254:1614-2498(-)